MFNHGGHETKKNSLKNPRWTMEELGKTKWCIEDPKSNVLDLSKDPT